MLDSFSSDLRTHIEEKRWNEFTEELTAFETKYLSKNYTAVNKDIKFKLLESNNFNFKNSSFELDLEPKKGLAINRLKFKDNPIEIGKIPFGHFRDVSYLADFILEII